MDRKIISVLFFCLGFLTCYAQKFSEVAFESGIIHYHFANGYMGGGIGVIDFNNDGWEDIYLTGGQQSDKLYQNLGDGTFMDVSAFAGIDAITKDIYTFGIAVGDVNNDGCSDIFIACFDRNKRNILLLNDCFGGFYDATADFKMFERSASTAAVFVDVNKDGFLDLYVNNYIDRFEFIDDDEGIIVDIDRSCLPNYFYMNQGGESFKEVAFEQNMDNDGCSLAITATDFDLDQDQDIYVANDHGEFVEPNILFQNNYPSDSFNEVQSQSGLDVAFYAMGIAQGDINNDGYFDYYVTNLGHNALMMSDENGRYSNVAHEKLISNGQYENGDMITGWGTNFVDIDNDSDLDLFVANGFIRAGYFNTITRWKDTNKMYLNTGGGNFVDSTELINGYGLDFVNRGSVSFDFDKDGDQDLLVATASEDNKQYTLLYRNDFADETQHWLKISLEGKQSNKDAFGSLIYLYAVGQKFIKESHGGGSHASQSSPILHFGLADSEGIDSLVIVWPSGSITKQFDLATKQHILLQEGSNDFDVLGCLEEDSANYNPLATLSWGCQKDVILGCTDPNSDNYSENVTVNDGTCSLSTAVTDPKLEQFYLYPNPTDDRLIIRNDSNITIDRVRVINQFGQEIPIFVQKNTDQYTIRFNAIMNGIYFLQIEVDRQIVLKKFSILK